MSTLHKKEENKIKFIHIADVHLDAWREKELKKLNFRAFEHVVDECIKRDVDFLLISGDIFHVSMPSFKAIKFFARQLRRLKEKKIRVFAIPGSHDLSSDDTSLLYIFEEADLLTLTSKGEIKGGKLFLFPYEEGDVVVYGVLGRKGELDSEIYKSGFVLKDVIKYKDHYKIFQFHIGIQEVLPAKIATRQSISLNLLPERMDYYAGGHIHLPLLKDWSTVKEEKYLIVYPGALYPSNYGELEELKGKGRYVYVEAYKKNGKWISHVNFLSLEFHPVISVEINCNNLTPSQVVKKTINALREISLQDSILLLKFFGNLEGVVSHIDFREIEKYCASKGVYVLKKNTFNLRSKIYGEDYDVIEKEDMKLEEVEKEVVQNILRNVKAYSFDVSSLTSLLLKDLSESKHEEESKTQYHKRVVEKCLQRVLSLMEKEDVKGGLEDENKRDRAGQY